MSAAARRAAAALTSRTTGEAVAVLAGFGLMAVLMTWPLAAHFGTRIPGTGQGGDASGYVWDYWYNATHGLRLWGTSVQDYVSAPFGRVLPGSVNATLLLSVGPAWVVAKLASPIAAYNTVVLSGVALSGASMYLLVRWLRLGVGPALWAGISFALFPYMILRMLGHAPLTHLECFPVMIMAGLHWTARPGWRRAVLMALALALAWLTNPYYGVMCGVMLAVFVAWGFCASLRRAPLRTAAARVGEAAAAAVILVGIPLAALFLSSRGAVEGVFRRKEIELLLYGAQLTDYVRPLGDNPVWRTVFGSPFPSPSGERLNYVGWVTIAMALTGLGVALWRRSGIDRPRRTAALIALPMIPVLVLLSLASPMHRFGHDLTMPSKLVFELLPFLRAFARFVVPVMAVLLVAGAVGLWYLLRDRTPLWRMCILVTVLMLSIFDLPSPLPLSSAEPVRIDGRSAANVPTWAWLRDHPNRDIVFEMPGQPNELIERYYMYGQLVHGHPIANGNLFPGQLGYDFVSQTGVPEWPNTSTWLSSVGIRLVTINPYAYRLAEAQSPKPNRPPKGFRVVRVFSDGSAIWEVTAAAAPVVPVFRTGWWASQLLGDGAIWRWMKDRAQITLVPRAPGAYEMSFRARGFEGRPHLLEIRMPDGGIQRVAVGAERTVRLPVTLTGNGDVELVNLGPEAKQIGPGDARIVSVQISEPALSPVANPGARTPAARGSRTS